MTEINHASSDEERYAKRKEFEKLIENLPRPEGPAPEVVAKMKSLVEEIADRDYPDVWVGKAGMTAVHLLELQEMNEGLPEEMRLEPGEVVQAEGTDGGFQIPEVGGTRLSGLDVVRYLKDEMDPIQFEELWDEVVRVNLAKEGKVLRTIFLSSEGLPDINFTTTVDEIPAAWAEEFIAELEFYAQGGMGFDYVIPETERVKDFLAEHGEYFG